MRTWPGLLLLVGAVVLAGCAELTGKSYGSLELTRPVGVASVPFEVGASRSVEYGCDTSNKINPCRDGSEALEILSATCDGAGCTAEPSRRSAVRVVASRPGRYAVHVEARGAESGDSVSADTTVEVLDVTDVKVEITVDLGNPLYTALDESGRAVLSARLVARDGRTVDRAAGAVRWSASGATVAPWEPSGQQDTTRIAGATAGTMVVGATFSPDVSGESRVEVRALGDAVRTRVAVHGSELDPTELDATPGEYSVYVPIELHVVLEDAAGRLFAGPAERLRVEGAGCTLARLSPRLGSVVDLDATARQLEVDVGARCTLVVGEGAAARRIPVKRDAPRTPARDP